MSFSLCGLVSTHRGAMGISGWSGSTRVTETSGRPMSRTLWSKPWSAAWSATRPEMIVVPSFSLERLSPSNQAAHRGARWPLRRISYRLKERDPTNTFRLNANIRRVRYLNSKCGAANGTNRLTHWRGCTSLSAVLNQPGDDHPMRQLLVPTQSIDIEDTRLGHAQPGDPGARRRR